MEKVGGIRVVVFVVLMSLLILTAAKPDKAAAKVVSIERRVYFHEFDKYKFNVDSIVKNSSSFTTFCETFKDGLKVSEYVQGFQLTRQTVFKYNKKRLLVLELIYDYPEINRQWRDSIVYSYDSKGRLSRRVVYPFDRDEPLWIDSFKYNGDTVFLGTDEEYKSGDVWYKYTNKAKTEFVSGGMEKWVCKRELSLSKVDKFGNETEVFACDADTCKPSYSISYLYNEYGNWIRKMMFDENKKLSSVEVQKIIYEKK